MGTQLRQYEQNVISAQKRLASLNEHRAKFVAEIADGQECLLRLRIKVSQIPQPTPPAALLPDLVVLQILREL